MVLISEGECISIPPKKKYLLRYDIFLLAIDCTPSPTPHKSPISHLPHCDHPSSLKGNYFCRSGSAPTPSSSTPRALDKVVSPTHVVLVRDVSSAYIYLTRQQYIYQQQSSFTFTYRFRCILSLFVAVDHNEVGDSPRIFVFLVCF